MTWQLELQRSVHTLDDLSQVASLNDSEKEQMAAILERSPMLATPYYLSLIDFEDENDPIKKMALPSLAEADRAGSDDTSGESDNTVVRGLQHKYHETALLLTTSICATYCRHCFRKRLVGLPDEDSVRDLEAVHEYITAHPEIANVLVSGGDALLNSNERLGNILEMLTSIPHLQYIRIASRTPVVLPSRVTEDEELLDMLAHYNEIKQLYVVTQFDHPREVTPEATSAVKAFLERGIPVRNQTVLLRDVNDDARVLSELLGSLVSIGVEPYYVFQCRPVTGVKNLFQVPLRRGIEIVEEAKGMQSGLAKAFRYCMSHVTGKIEILGTTDEGKMLFKYHEAKDRRNLGKLFTEAVSNDQAWLD